MGHWANISHYLCTGSRFFSIKPFSCLTHNVNKIVIYCPIFKLEKVSELCEISWRTCDYMLNTQGRVNWFVYKRIMMKYFRDKVMGWPSFNFLDRFPQKNVFTSRSDRLKKIIAPRKTLLTYEQTASVFRWKDLSIICLLNLPDFTHFYRFNWLRNMKIIDCTTLTNFTWMY